MNCKHSAKITRICQGRFTTQRGAGGGSLTIGRSAIFVSAGAVRLRQWPLDSPYVTSV